MNNVISEYRPLTKLKEWKQNPKTILKQDFERLKAQILKLGMYKPLIITDDGTVIGGNSRFKALLELGAGEAWVSVVNPKNEAEKLEYALSDNDEIGHYDKELLAELVLPYQQEIDLSEYKVNLENSVDLDSLLGEFQPRGSNGTGTDGLTETYEVVVEANNEAEQQLIFEKLQEQGYKCRLLTL